MSWSFVCWIVGVAYEFCVSMCLFEERILWVEGNQK